MSDSINHTDNEPTRPCCRVCGSLNSVYLCNTYNEHSTTHTLKHFRCRDCGSVFVGNNIDIEELCAAYSTLDSNRYYKETGNASDTKLASAVARLGELTSRNGSIIDIGAGNGHFLELLYAAGFKNISAHEIPGGDLSKLKNIGCNIYQNFNYMSIPSDSFDAVTLLDVVEHVIDPTYLIITCNRILKMDGVIYFHTPVVTKIDRMMHFFQKLPILNVMGRIWQRGRTSVFHLQNYTQRSIEKLLRESGFDDIHITLQNELSWPVSRYIKIYLLEKQGLPGFIAPLLYPFFAPLFATNYFNSNKAIVSARKISTIG